MIFPIIPTPSPGWSNHTAEVYRSIKKFIKIDAIKDPTPDQGDLRADLYVIMQEGDLWHGRCLPSYKIGDFGHPPKIINVTNCNVISVLVALAFRNLLLPMKIPLLNLRSGIYRGTYYNNITDSIETGLFVYEEYFNTIKTGEKYMEKVLESKSMWWSEIPNFELSGLSILKIEQNLEYFK
jgi:hypothetical protein